MALGGITIKMSEDAIRDLGHSKSGLVWQDIVRRGNRVLNSARRRVPKDTGRLGNSITMELVEINGAPGARIGTNLEYAIYVHEGTANNGAGFIYPKSGTYLRFPSVNNSGAGRRRYQGGSTAAYVYARRVRGVKGRPFLTDALADAG
jgi:hypothetical protein